MDTTIYDFLFLKSNTRRSYSRYLLEKAMQDTRHRAWAMPPQEKRIIILGLMEVTKFMQDGRTWKIYADSGKESDAVKSLEIDWSMLEDGIKILNQGSELYDNLRKDLDATQASLQSTTPQDNHNSVPIIKPFDPLNQIVEIKASHCRYGNKKRVLKWRCVTSIGGVEWRHHQDVIENASIPLAKYMIGVMEKGGQRYRAYVNSPEAPEYFKIINDFKERE